MKERVIKLLTIIFAFCLTHCKKNRAATNITSPEYKGPTKSFGAPKASKYPFLGLLPMFATGCHATDMVNQSIEKHTAQRVRKDVGWK